MRGFIAGLVGVLAVVWGGSVRGETVSVDFSRDLGTYFQVGGPAAGLFAVNSYGSGVDISKPADNRTVSPKEWIGPTVRSLFNMVGDFSITVDYALLDFPKPTDVGINEAHLSVFGATTGDEIVRRFWANGNNNFKDYFVDTSVSSSDTAGQMRIERVGSTYTSSFCPAGETSFTIVAHFSGFNTEPMYVQLLVAQNRDSESPPGLRSNTSLDVRFDHLLIQADGFEGSIPVPEPSTLLLLGIGAIGFLGWAWRRRKRA